MHQQEAEHRRQPEGGDGEGGDDDGAVWGVTAEVGQDEAGGAGGEDEGGAGEAGQLELPAPVAQLLLPDAARQVPALPREAA